jgi:predicted ATP-dependent serine protease
MRMMPMCRDCGRALAKAGGRCPDCARRAAAATASGRRRVVRTTRRRSDER